MTVAVDMRQLMADQDREPVLVSQTDLFHNLRIASALAIEINSGVRFGNGSVMLVARRMCNSTHRTKQAVLKDYVVWLGQWLEDNMPPGTPTYQPNPSVQRALDK